MIDWKSLEELYSASQSENARARQAAERAIESGVERWVAEYIGTEYSQVEFEKLATFVTGWLDRRDAETNAEWSARANRMKEDRLGILLRHALLTKARELRKTDRDWITLFGDKFLLNVWWTNLPGSERLVPEL